MSSTTPFPISYTSADLVVRELNLQVDTSNPNNYFIWQISTPIDFINQQVTQANERTTMLFGNTTPTPNYYALCRQYATFLASKFVLQKGVINWQVSGMKATLGNLSVDRLEAMSRAATILIEKTYDPELYKLYIQLSDIVTVNAYNPQSPYVDTRGGTFYS